MAKAPLRSIYNNPDEILREADDASMAVLNDWWKSETELVDPMRDLWEEWYRMYRCYTEIDDDDILSNFPVPATWAHIESFVPNIVANRPRIEVWDAEPNDAGLAAMHRALIFYYWRKNRLKLELVPYVKGGLIWGTTIWKVRHTRQTAMRSMRKPTPTLLELKMRFQEQVQGLPPGTLVRPVEFDEVETTIYDDPVLEPVDLDFFYPHPDMRDFESAERDGYGVIEERPTEWQEIEREMAAGNPSGYDPEVVKMIGKKLEEGGNPRDRFSDSHKQKLRDRFKETFGPEMVPQLDPQRREVTLFTQTFASKKVTIVKEFPDLPPLRNGSNRYGMINFAKFTPIPDPANGFYGISLGEMMYSLNLELTVMHNARMDHILGAIHPMFSVIRGSGVNPAAVRWRPWGHIEMDDHTDMQPIVLPEMKVAAYREIGEIDSWLQKIGQTNPGMGFQSPSGGDATATEASLNFRASGSRAGLMYHVLSYQPLERLGKLWIKCSEMFKSIPQVVRITGREQQPQGQEQPELGPAEIEPGVVRTDPETLSRGFSSEPDLIIDIGQEEPETRQFRLQRSINALQTVGQIPLEAWANPIIQKLGVQMLQGTGDEYAHETVQQLVQGVSQQALQAQLAEQQAKAQAAGAQTEGQQLSIDQGGSQGPRP